MCIVALESKIKSILLELDLVLITSTISSSLIVLIDYLFLEFRLENFLK